MELSAVAPPWIPNSLHHCQNERLDLAHPFQSSCMDPQISSAPSFFFEFFLLNWHSERDVFKINSLTNINNLRSTRFVDGRWKQLKTTFTTKQSSYTSNSWERIMRLGCNTVPTSKTHKTWEKETFRVPHENYSNQQIFKKSIWSQSNFNTN